MIVTHTKVTETFVSYKLYFCQHVSVDNAHITFHYHDNVHFMCMYSLCMGLFTAILQ